MDELEIRKSVRARYGQTADGCCADEACGCGSGTSSAGAAAKADVGAILRLGVGDPMERLAPRDGETVLDLGSGPGRDVLYAAERVGAQGTAIGVDATPEMVFRAREAAQALGRSNADFRLGEIEHLPVETASVDGISSDCVVNLSPDKARVFREAFRVLKPGGRIVVSDVVADAPLPEEVRRDGERWAACEAGAVTLAEYESGLRDAGFEDIRTEVHGSYRPGLSRATVTARRPRAGL